MIDGRERRTDEVVLPIASGRSRSSIIRRGPSQKKTISDAFLWCISASHIARRLPENSDATE